MDLIAPVAVASRKVASIASLEASSYGIVSARRIKEDIGERLRD